MATKNIFLLEVKQFFSNIKTNIMLFIIAPFALALIYGVMFDKILDPDRTIPKFNVIFVNYDNGTLSKPLETVLNNDKVKSFINLTNSSDLNKTKNNLIKGNSSAAIVIPKGFSEDITKGIPASIEVLKAPSEETNGDIVSSIVSSYTENINVNRGLYLALNKNINDNEMKDKVLKELTSETYSILSKNYVSETSFEKSKKMSSKQYFSLTMFIMFGLFIATNGASFLLKEREDGILARIRSTSTKKGSYLAGKLLATFLTSLIQIASFMILTRLIMKVDWGNNIIFLVIMAVINALLVTGLSALFAGLFKTLKMLRVVTPFLLMIMASLSGSFYPIGNATGVMSVIPKLTFNYWLINGYSNVILGSPIPSVSLDIIVLLAISIAGLAVGCVSFKYEAK